MNIESAQIMSYVFEMDNKPGDISFNTREGKDDRPTLQIPGGLLLRARRQTNKRGEPGAASKMSRNTERQTLD